MKYYLLSDNIDTKIGMRLAGINGEIVHTKIEFEKAFNKIKTSPDIAILLITQKLASENISYISNHKISKKVPLIVEIPDRLGAKQHDNLIADYIKDTIGIKEI